MNRGNQKPTETIESLRGLKQRIYLWVVTAGLFAILVVWIPSALAGTTSAYERIIFPATAILCVGSLIALRRTVRALIWVELGLFAATALSLLSQVVMILETPQTFLVPNHIAALSNLLFWFPLVYIFAFLVFDNRRQLLIGSLIFFGISVVLGLSVALPEYMSNGESADLSLLIPFYLANLVYIFLLMAGVRLNEHYIRVRILAETMTLLAHTDSLIRIANRRELDSTIESEIKRIERHAQPLSAILFDLDFFKQVNDNYGHEAGDTVLKEIAIVVQAHLRRSDLLGRWGGEEFLVITPQTDSIQARTLAERLRKAIFSHPLEDVGTITASFGVAEYHPPESAEAWLKRADDALYAAKQGGRNQVITE